MKKVVMSEADLLTIREGFEACLRWPYLDFDEHVRQKPGKGIEGRKDREGWAAEYVSDVRSAQHAIRVVDIALADLRG